MGEPLALLGKWPVVAAVALVTAWLLAPAAVPLYDGIGNPDEPYRWVKPPAGAKATKPPTPALEQMAASGGRTLNQAVASSAEIGPQIQLYLPALSVSTPTAATSVSVTATPIAPQPPLPDDGAIVTNVYRVRLTSDAGAATIRAVTRTATPVIQMRAPTARQPGPTFEHRAGSRWVQVETKRIGFDVYQAYMDAPGDWALVQPWHQPSEAKDEGGEVRPWLLWPGVGLLVATIVVLVVRTQRMRRAPQ